MLLVPRVQAGTAESSLMPVSPFCLINFSGEVFIAIVAHLEADKLKFHLPWMACVVWGKAGDAHRKAWRPVRASDSSSSVW